MLDDLNVLSQRDSEKTLDSSVIQFEQTVMDVTISHPEHDQRPIDRVVCVGMGGSALAPELIKTWLDSEINVPF